MKIERDERKFDFHGIGLAIKKAREREGMTQEQLGYIVDRDPRTIMYHENDGQHPSLNAFYQMVTMFGISVDEYKKLCGYAPTQKLICGNLLKKLRKNAQKARRTREKKISREH